MHACINAFCQTHRQIRRINKKKVFLKNPETEEKKTNEHIQKEGKQKDKHET